MPVQVHRDGDEITLSPPVSFDYYNYNYYNFWQSDNTYRWWQQIPIVVEISFAGDDLCVPRQF